MWKEHQIKNHGDQKKKFIDSIIKERASGPVGPMARRG